MVESQFDAERRRALMARFRGKDTKPEVLVRKLLHRRGLRFRLHRRDLPGKPDIVLPRLRVVIFVHGCFWHHHSGCSVARIPQSNPDYWTAKFRGNKERDARVAGELSALGWRVVTIWECQAKSPGLEETLAQLGVLSARPRGSSTG